jgi:hypothetical protein
MRRISFAMTQDQILRQEKTVTRRMGWLTLKKGTLLRAVDRVMGFKKGEKAKVLGVIRVISATREILRRGVNDLEVEREGFPQLTPKQFVEMFCLAMRCQPDDEVTRIEFEYVEDEMVSWAPPPVTTYTMKDVKAWKDIPKK